MPYPRRNRVGQIAHRRVVRHRVTNRLRSVMAARYDGKPRGVT